MTNKEARLRELAAQKLPYTKIQEKLKAEFGSGMRKKVALGVIREVQEKPKKLETVKYTPTKYKEKAKRKEAWQTGKPEELKGRIVYEKVTKPAFQSKYTYLMAFANLNIKTEEVQWKYIHLTSNTPKTKKELKTMLREVVLENEENMDKYEEWIPIIDSITLVMAWVAEGGEKPSEKGAQTERKQV